MSDEARPARLDGAPHTVPSALIHDMRTPLNHIIGYSELMMEDAQQPGAAELLPHLQKVCAAGHHLLAIINESFRPDRSEDCPGAAAPPEESRAPDPGTDPATAAAVEAMAAESMASAAARGALLVVDDDEVTRDTLSRRLEHEGYAAAAVASGADALGMLRAYTFDLVLLDIMMPDMDGYEVLRRLKADERLREIPVIVISALTDVDGIARCIELGADDYLSKPFHSTLLRARIGASLERKRARDTEVYLSRKLQEDERRLKTLETSRFDPRS